MDAQAKVHTVHLSSIHSGDSGWRPDYLAEAVTDLLCSQFWTPLKTTSIAVTIQARTTSKKQSIHQSNRNINDAGTVSKRTAMYHHASFVHLGRQTSRLRPTAYQKTAARQRWRPANRKSKGVLTFQLSEPFANSASAISPATNVAGRVPMCMA